MLIFVVLQVTGKERIILGRLKEWFNGLGGDEALMEEEERPAMARDVLWGGEVPELFSHSAGQGLIATP